MRKKHLMFVLCCMMFCSAVAVFFSMPTQTTLAQENAQSQEISDFLRFEQAIIDLNNSQDQQVIVQQAVLAEVEIEEDIVYEDSPSADFSLKRLIVQGNVTNTYSATDKVSFGNLSILCYKSEKETKDAFEKLTQNPNLDVVVDKVEKVDGYAQQDYTYTNKNWGVEAIDVGGYKQFLVDSNVQDEVVVVVMDTGINTSHAMFANRLLKDKVGKIRGFSYCDSKYKYRYRNLGFDVDDLTTQDIDESDLNKYSFEDDNGHGTHVAGIICDLTPKNVKILPIKVGNFNGHSSTSIFLAAYLRVINIYSKQYKIACTNLSFSGAGKSSESDKNQFNQQCYQPMKELGILAITAAGNENEEINIEGLEAIVVSALKKSEGEYKFENEYSNYGKMIDISAPGTDVESAWIAESNGASSAYETHSGTSMASPQVAGVVALLALHPDYQTFTAEEMEQKLYDLAVDLGDWGRDDYYGYGMANIKYFEAEDFDETLSFYRDNVLIEEHPNWKNFEDDFTLKIECSDASYQIIYTTNQALPTLTNSAVYSNPMAVTDSIYLNVMGVKVDNGTVVAKTDVYNVAFFDSGNSLEQYFEILQGTLIKYTGHFENLVIPTVMKGQTVKAVGNSLFLWNNLQSITLPQTVTSISGYAFQNCKDLVYVDAPGVEVIYVAGFSGCDSLTMICDRTPAQEETEGVFLPKLTTTKGFVFNICKNLQSVSLSKLATVGHYDFQACYQLTSAYLPAVKVFEEGFFAFCENLTGTFFFGEDLESIGTRAFSHTKIKRFDVAKGNSKIYTDGLGVYTKNTLVAFAAGNTNINYEILSSVSIGGETYTITKLGEVALGLVELNKLTIPSTINTIGAWVGSESKIHHLYFDAHNCSEDGYFKTINGITGICQPWDTFSIIEIGPNATRVPLRIFQEVYFDELIINSRATVFETASLYRFRAQGVLNKLVFNFADKIDTSYLNMIVGTSALCTYNDINYIYSKAEVPVRSSLYLSSLRYSTHDGEYYIYSKTPIVAEEKFVINASSSPYGKISPSGENYFTKNSSATFMFEANAGCYVESIKIDGVVLSAEEIEVAESIGYTFENIERNHTIEVVFARNVYTITVVQAQNGSISNAADRYYYGDEETFAIVPNAGYYVEYLIVDDKVVYDHPSWHKFLYITENHTISAKFSPRTDTKYTARFWFESLTIDGATRFGDKYYNLVSDEIYAGTTAQMTQVVAQSYEGFALQPFAQKLIEGNGSTVVDVLYNRNTYTVNLTKGEGVTSVSGNGNYLFGQTVTLNAILAEGYDFSIWTSSNSSAVPNGNVAQYSFAMPATSIGLSAKAEIRQLSVVIRETANGRISPATNQTVNYGNDLQIEVEADYGYKLNQLLINGKEVSAFVVDGKYTIENIKTNCIVSATFDLTTHTITATSNYGGEIGEETVFVVHGQSQNCIFTPYEGYKIADVKVNGVSVGIVTQYVFDNVQADQTLEVTFEKLVFTIEVVCGDNGSVSPSGLVSVEYGNSKTFVFTPDQNYGISVLELNGEKLAITTSLIIENVTQNQTLRVVFAQMFLISSTSDENGSITQSGVVLLGGQKRFDFQPNQGFQVKDVKVDGISIGVVDFYTFVNVDRAHTIAVEYEIKKLNIVLYVDGQGVVQSSSLLTDVLYGDDRTLSIVADDGWKLNKIFVNGKEVQALNNQLVISDIVEDLTIQVVFEKSYAKTAILAAIIVGSVTLLGAAIIFTINISKKMKKKKMDSMLNNSLTQTSAEQQAQMTAYMTPNPMVNQALNLASQNQQDFVKYCEANKLDHKQNYVNAALSFYQSHNKKQK